MSDLILKLPDIVTEQILLKCNPGEIVDYSSTSKQAKMAVHDLFNRENPKQQSFQLLFAKNYSQIFMQCKQPQWNYTWKFMKSEDMDKSWGRVHRTKNTHVFGVKESDKASFAVQFFCRIRDVFPAPIERCVIDTEAFCSSRKSARIACEIAKIKRVQNMYIMGNWESSVACDILLNNISVAQDLIVREFVSPGKLNFEKIAPIPKAQICVHASTTPEQVFEASGGIKYITIPTMSYASLNKIILLWMNSGKSDVERLTILVRKMEDEPVRDMFRGLKLVRGVEDIEWVVHGPPDKRVTPSRLWHLIRTGVELRRPDGAIATIFFSPVLPLMTFTMRAEYPGRQSLANLIPAYHEQIVEEMWKYSAYNLKHNEKEHVAKLTQKWVKENRRKLDTEELRRHARYQQKISAKHVWWTWKEAISTRNCEYAQKFEVKQYDTSQERRRGGYLVLA